MSGLIKTITSGSSVFWQSRAMLAELVRADFKLRYQASMLGYAWSLLKPLFLFAILYTVFAKVLRFGEGIPNYALSLLLAIVLWNYFAEATARSLKSIVAKGSLLRKIAIPKYLLPVADVVSALINMALSLIAVFVFIIFSEGNAISLATLFIFPLLLLELIVFTTGVGLILSTIYVKFRDIDYIWEVARQALFYGIPIIYPLTRVPEGIFRDFIILNPIAQVIQDSRALITYDGSITLRDVHPSYFMIIPILISIATFVIGVLVFRSNSGQFAEKV